MTKREFQAIEYADELRARAENFDLSQLEAKPLPLAHFLLELSRIHMDIKTLSQAAEPLKHDRTQLQNIRATLFVNYVSKSTDGISFTREEFEQLESKAGTHGLVYEVLLRYSKNLQQQSASPV